MRSIIRIVAVVTLIAAGTSAANAVYLRCPLDQARRTITDRLPPHWWTTPIVDRLSRSRIDVIAGKRTLVCQYGRAGTIQREIPRGMVCRAAGSGFDCETTTGAVPALRDYEAVQKWYSRYKTANTCVQFRQIVEHIRGYGGNRRPVPESFRYTVRYPSPKPSPTISDLAVDRILRIRESKPHCF